MVHKNRIRCITGSLSGCVAICLVTGTSVVQFAVQCRTMQSSITKSHARLLPTCFWFSERLAVRQFQPALRALQRLNMRLFVHAQHHGIFRRIQVQPDHVGRFLRKAWIRADTPAPPPLQRNPTVHFWRKNVVIWVQSLQPLPSQWVLLLKPRTGKTWKQWKKILETGKNEGTLKGKSLTLY